MTTPKEENLTLDGSWQTGITFPKGTRGFQFKVRNQANTLDYRWGTVAAVYTTQFPGVTKFENNVHLQVATLLYVRGTNLDVFEVEYWT